MDAARSTIRSISGTLQRLSASSSPTQTMGPSRSDVFPRQGPGTPYSGIGNLTRFNPKVRYFPNLNENISVAKSFVIHEQVRLDFRAEAFNAFNRVRFGTGSTSLQSQTFGRLTSNSDLLNTPRQMQLALKLYF